MELREIGKLFLIGFPGMEFSPEVRDLLEDLDPSGVILFSRNIMDPPQIAALNHAFQENALARSPAGLLIGVDQEGGRVRRLKEHFTRFPPALESASSRNPDDRIREFARVTAQELRLVGFNLDFVPVLDVLSQQEDLDKSVIGDRSYGFEPSVVSRLGGIVTETMRAAGVIPCGKHFPGHGGTAVDSHKDLPVDDRSLEIIRSRDLAPFKEAVNAQVEMLMTAHVLYPALDPVLPATLSPLVIDELLRKQMKYDGVVITDDLDMGAVARHYSPDDCALKAFSAGADILLICNNPEKAISARDRIFEAIQTGEVPVDRLRQSLRRIAHLKAKYASSFRPCDPKKAAEYFET
jgi:beta-N-acetylhexosaminidase